MPYLDLVRRFRKVNLFEINFVEPPWNCGGSENGNEMICWLKWQINEQNEKTSKYFKILQNTSKYFKILQNTS